MLLVNGPVPEPSVVWGSVRVGAALVLQQTPRAVTGDPPSVVTLPPEVAEVMVITVAALVATAAAQGINVRSLPLVVPSELTATRRK